jgi:hypothetical protein
MNQATLQEIEAIRQFNNENVIIPAMVKRASDLGLDLKTPADVDRFVKIATVVDQHNINVNAPADNPLLKVAEEKIFAAVKPDPAKQLEKQAEAVVQNAQVREGLLRLLELSTEA